MGTIKKDVLIAYLPSAEDLKILYKKRWYRIPVDTKLVPSMIKEKKIKLIAFYQPRAFEDDAFAVRFYGKVRDIDVVSRKELFPNEPGNEKFDKQYYKIKIDKLYRLPQPIKSLRHRRILFITTTFGRFKKAKEINDLFYESPLEEILWRRFKLNKLYAERQFLETVKNKNFILDFAVFCKERKIDIETDGDRYHTKKEEVHKDKQRDNMLESQGWSVLRYTTDDLINHPDESLAQVKETINRYGGVEDPTDSTRHNFYPKDYEQDTLFD